MKFSAIMADPPWAYAGHAYEGLGPRGDWLGVDARKRYPTMTTAEIKALPVAAYANRDSLLFLWTTNAHLASGQATEVARAWGFEPKTVVTWAKTKAGTGGPSMKTGHWFRGASEHIIVSTRGSPKRPRGFPALPTWMGHGRLPHSVKPDLFYSIVEQCAPDGPWLEMFARRDRPGWSVWGNEVDSTFSFDQRGAPAGRGARGGVAQQPLRREP